MYFFKKLLQKLSLLLTVLVTISFFMTSSVADAGVANSLDNIAVEFLHDDFTDGGMKNNENGVGSYALYVLNKSGVDISAWEYNGETLEDSVTSAIYADISNAGEKSAKLLAQDLAAAIALNQNGYKNQLIDILANRQTATGFDDSLFDNIPAFDLLGEVGLMNEIDTVLAENYILGQQNTTGANDVYSWGFTYGGTYYPDFITTAKAIRALHYLDPGQSDTDIQDAIDNGLDWMENQQQGDGSFVAGYPGMDDPLKDTAEAIVTLATLDIDLESWTSAVDYLLNDALNEDGSFGANEDVQDAILFFCAYGLVDNGFYIYPSSATIAKDNTRQLKAMRKTIAGTADVTNAADWSVTDSSIVSIDNSGLVSALKAGQTVVQAVYEGLTATADLKVESSQGGINPDVSTEVEVGMAVVDQNGELLFDPRYFMVDDTNEFGLTVLGALDASGADYTTGYWEDWGYYVDSIEGLAGTGSAGWMYAVNNVPGAVLASNCSIKGGEKIVWYYASSMDAQPPLWSDLVNKSSVVVDSVELTESGTVSDTVLNTAIQNAESAGEIVLQADDAKTSLALSNDQLTKILNIGKPLAVTVQGVQIVFPPESLKIPEITGGNAAQLVISAEKLSDWEIQTKIKSSYNEKLKPAGDIYELNVLVVDRDNTQQKVKQIPGCKIILLVPEGFLETAGTGMVLAYRYNEARQTWEFLGGTYDQQNNTVSFYTNHFSKYALLAATSSFDDLDGHWAQKEIEIMAANGFIAGMGDGVFAPDATVSRAEFVTILTKIAGLTANSEKTAQFSDVPADAWYRDSVYAAVYHGIVFGTSADRFTPDGPISREQMAAMIERLLAKKKLDHSLNNDEINKILAGFTDTAAIHSWARTPVALAVQERLMSGRGNGQFVPQGNATRAEAALILYLLLQKLL
ncbi:MAG: hypothetical protein VR69_03740 [Peptococcaceae bacterium BRH_c4b]|nr:MAG: hypothetical protein VR69_03740 [Peptococcaceae bacterium BRH_c4b]